MSLLEEICYGPGYSRMFELDSEEVSYLTNIVTKQWRKVIDSHFADETLRTQRLWMGTYHNLDLSHRHARLWPKKNRILPYSDLAPFKCSGFFSDLQRHLGVFRISNEDRVEPEEIYWRIVRPGEGSDIGPIHADRWFWDLGHGEMPTNTTRIKVWIPLIIEPGKNGLLVVPDSHKKSWNYCGEMRDGRLKPRLLEDISTLSPILLNTRPGDAVIFNDNLLHGGSPNLGSFCRVSIEFTIFYDGVLS